MKIAISVGDLNGIGIELALRGHQEVKNICEPLYFINETMLNWSAAMLNIEVPHDFTIEDTGEIFEIKPGQICGKSGSFSYESFEGALNYTKNGKSCALVTLPISKDAWFRGGICHKGHTEALKFLLDSKPIMMIGCDKLYTALFTHHIPLSEVFAKIKTKKILKFLKNLYENIKETPIGVLALNPHAGEGGLLGGEEREIWRAIEMANEYFGEEIFVGPLVADTAFTKKNLEKFKYYVAMYHDQGLIGVKSLFFEESVNVSLNLPIIRTSPDHGTAFDIAYKNQNPSTKSYINAVKEALKLASKQKEYIL